MQKSNFSYLRRRDALMLLGALPMSQLVPGGLSKLAAGNIGQQTIIALEYPEVYELSNIILALTKHGIEDKWEVQKDFPYYETVRRYFEPFRSHSVVSAANYSRERWKELLSFRTDAYAFAFSDDGQLERTSDFQAFEIRAFDENLAAVQDFAEKSRFRDFFKAQHGFRTEVISGYARNYLIEEMRAFLRREFDDFFSNKRYVVALSPFVGAQNLHRNISDTLTVDFPPIALPILNGNDLTAEKQASAIHTLFTEMDHGYVNPTTLRYAERIGAEFDDGVWSQGSGYEKYPLGVFNEYMTWALFDIFVEERFPAYADQVSYNWHLQNQSRGFTYSYDFAQVLLDLRHENPTVPVKDLYPVLIDRLSALQPTLSKPYVTNGSDNIVASDLQNTWIDLEFTEPMARPDELTVAVWQDGHANLYIDLTNRDMSWNEDSTRLSLRLPGFDRPFERVAIVLNDRGAKHRLFSQKGIILSGRSGLYVASS